MKRSRQQCTAFRLVLWIVILQDCLARTWEDVVNPRSFVSTIGILDLALLENALETDPFRFPEDKIPGSVTTAPPTAQYERHDSNGGCSNGEHLYEVSMYDSFGDGWDKTNLTITQMSQLDSRGKPEPFYDDNRQAVTFSAQVDMEDLEERVILQKSLRRGHEGYNYVCLKSDRCYRITVRGGLWEEEVTWQIRSVPLGISRAERNSGLSNAIAKGHAPTFCYFSIPADEETGELSCPFTCHNVTNEPLPFPSSSSSGIPSDVPSLFPTSVPSSVWSDAPSLVPSIVPSPSPSQSPSIVLFGEAVVTSAEQPCLDDPEFGYMGLESSNCVWVGEKESEGSRYCGLPWGDDNKLIRDFCPLTCGKCVPNQPLAQIMSHTGENLPILPPDELLPSMTTKSNGGFVPYTPPADEPQFNIRNGATNSPVQPCTDDPDFRYLDAPEANCDWVGVKESEGSRYCGASACVGKVVSDYCPVACGICDANPPLAYALANTTSNDTTTTSTSGFVPYVPPSDESLSNKAPSNPTTTSTPPSTESSFNSTNQQEQPTSTATGAEEEEEEEQQQQQQQKIAPSDYDYDYDYNSPTQSPQSETTTVATAPPTDGFIDRPVENEKEFMPCTDANCTTSQSPQSETTTVATAPPTDGSIDRPVENEKEFMPCTDANCNTSDSLAYTLSNATSNETLPSADPDESLSNITNTTPDDPSSGEEAPSNPTTASPPPSTEFSSNYTNQQEQSTSTAIDAEEMEEKEEEQQTIAPSDYDYDYYYDSDGPTQSPQSETTTAANAPPTDGSIENEKEFMPCTGANCDTSDSLAYALSNSTDTNVG